MRFAQFLVNAGAGEAAVAAAKKVVELDPKSARAWLVLAYAYEHDSFGRLRTGDWKQVDAEKAVRKAVQLDESHPEAAMEPAILLEHDAAGERYTKDARLGASVTLYQQMLNKGGNPAVSQNLTFALMHLARYGEAKEEMKKLTGQPI